MLAREELAQQERSLSTLIHSASGMAFCVLFAKGASQANVTIGFGPAAQDMGMHISLITTLITPCTARLELCKAAIHRDFSPQHIG